MQTRRGKRAAFFTVFLLLSACGGGGGGAVSSAPPTTLVTTPLTKWSDVQGTTNVEAKGVGKQLPYTYDTVNRRISGISDTATDTAVRAVFMFEDSLLTQVTIDSGGSLAGGPTSVLAADQDFVMAVSNTTNNSSKAVVSNPTSGAWNYQSFGVWENGLNTTNRTVGVFSVGNNTGTAIPVSGEATFTGKVIGSYINPLGQGNTVLADLNVGVDWGAKSLSFTTTNTQISSNPTTVAFSLAPSLDMTNQTLIYSGTANGFSGTLTTEGGLFGDTTGQFYGPDAEELGGVFALSSSTSVETYSGAYGAVQSPAP
jgi:hypothetical protein